MIRTYVVFSAAMFLLWGCKTADKPAGSGAAGGAMASAASHGSKMDGAYFEHQHDGRIYVLGSEESSKSFEATKHVPYTWTLLGEGPAGVTVVIEVDKDDPEHQKKLLAEFQRRNAG